MRLRKVRWAGCGTLRVWMGLLLVVAAAPGRADSPVETRRPPNIVLLMADDLGKEWLGCYGAEGIETPRLDRLAATGTRFENFWVMPQCTPTRVSLFTGQYPFRHGWVNHWDVPRWGGGAHFDTDRNPSLARAIRAAGYATAAAGKWQVNDFRVQPEALRAAGFDEYCMWTGGEGGNPASDRRYWDPYVHTADGSATRAGDFGEDVFVEFLTGFLERHRDEPVFLYYALCLPHGPLTSTPEEPHASGTLDRFRAMVRYVDAVTGRLVDAIDALGLREDTVIVWTTDNGTDRGITGRRNGRPVRGGKGTTDEAGVCVPLIVNAPGRVPAGQVSTALLSVVDLMPTLTRIAGGRPEPGHVYDGTEAAEALLGRTRRSPHEWILAMGGGNDARRTPSGIENAWVFRDRVIRTERYKLQVDGRRRPQALFDLLEDPFETRDLLAAGDAVAARVRDRLMAVVEDLPARDNDPVYTPLPAQPWDVEITAPSRSWKR